MSTRRGAFGPWLIWVVAVIGCNSGGSGGGPSQASTVGPRGGTVTSPNGVKLVIPEGALDAEVAITVEDVNATEIDSILSNPAISSTYPKHFLGGFTAKPDGLTFKVPVVATIPVPALTSQTPVPITVQLTPRTYAYDSSTLQYDGTAHTVTMQLNHFSTEVIAGLDHAAWDERCKELALQVETTATDSAAGGCNFIGDELSITFPLCRDTSTWHDCQYEATCPGTRLELKISPPNACLFVGREVTLSATGTGIANDQIVFEDVPLNPRWLSDGPSVVDFVGQEGTLRGVAPSPAPVKVRAHLASCGHIEDATIDANAFNLAGQWHAVAAVTSSSCSEPAHAQDDIIDVAQDGGALTLTSTTKGWVITGNFDDPSFDPFGNIERNWHGCPTTIHRCHKSLSADFNTVSVSCSWETVCRDERGNIYWDCWGTYGGSLTRITPDCP